MIRTFQKLLLVLVGLAVGAGLVAVTVLSWRILSPAPRPITPSDHVELRAALDENPRGLYQFDERLAYRMKPGFHGIRNQTDGEPHRTNSLGLLGTEEFATDPQVRKILFLGDSVTYGDGVPLDAVFVSLMQQTAGSTCQLANAGCPGWSTHQELAYFDEYLGHIPWDAVVVVLCLNDLVRFEWVYASDEGFRMSEEISAVGGLVDLTKSVAGLRLLAIRNRFNSIPGMEPLARQNNTVHWAWDSEKWRNYLEGTWLPFVERVDRPHLAIVVAPTRPQCEALRNGAPRDDVLFPQRQMAAFCRAHGLTCVDLVEPFEDADRQNSEPLFRDDLHFSRRGHQVAADAIWLALAVEFGMRRSNGPAERLSARPSPSRQ